MSHSVWGLKEPAGSPVRKSSVSGKQKPATAKSSPCSSLAKVIETLPLIFDSFDGSAFKKFRWATFGSLLAQRHCSKPAYQLLTENLQLLALISVPGEGRPFGAGFFINGDNLGLYIGWWSQNCFCIPESTASQLSCQPGKYWHACFTGGEIKEKLE